jgi:hypothetical protein
MRMFTPKTRRFTPRGAHSLLPARNATGARFGPFLAQRVQRLGTCMPARGTVQRRLRGLAVRWRAIMDNPRQPRDREAISATVESVVTAAVVVLLIASMITVLAILTSAIASPRVGDVLVFKPSTPVGTNETVAATLTVQAGGQGRQCDLNPAVMAQGGGSIVVENQSVAGKHYLVHWAGTHTAIGPQDCGRSADLSLSAFALQSLISSLGGRGLVGGGNVF